MFQELHREALQRVKHFNQSTVRLMEILNEIETKRAYLNWGYSSLWNYVLFGLNLSESQAHQFISVTRKSREIPELKKAIETGKVSLPKAALIVPELKIGNQTEWLAKAEELKTHELKLELAKGKPVLPSKERITVRSEEVLELKMGIKKETLEGLKRVQDLLSQKNRKSVSLEEALQVLTQSYLEKHDPEVRAKRLLCSNKVKPEKITQGRISLPAWVKHSVHKHYQSQCGRLLPGGKRCPERRFLEIHHRKPVSQGGSNLPENLILLCSGHHKANHLSLRRGAVDEAIHAPTQKYRLPRSLRSLAKTAGETP